MDIALPTALVLVLIGFAIGMVSGMVGIGGGLLVIPVLMFIFGFSQARANGTSLAMLLPPIGIFAVLAYHRAGNINWPFALIMGAGFAVGAYVGAIILNRGWINPTALRIGFAMLLLYCAGRILFRPGGSARAAVETTLLSIGFVGIYAVFRVIGKHWKPAPSWGAIYRGKQRASDGFDYEI